MRMKCLPIPHFDHSKFFSRTIVKEIGCWEWKGASRKDYGSITINQKDYFAHRVSYEIFKGIRENHTVIDHICKNKRCVNPDHLREVTININVMENSTCNAIAKKKQTHCVNGHEFTSENSKKERTGVYGGQWKQCKKCCSDRNKKWYKNKKTRLLSII